MVKERLPLMSFQEHLKELLWRLVTTFGSCILVIPAALLATKFVSEAFLWGVLAWLLPFHYLFLSQTMGWLLPGLYSHERRLLVVPGIWVAAVPFIAGLLLWAHFRLVDVQPLLTSHGRVWFVRYYLMLLTLPVVLYRPRRFRGFSPLIYLAAVGGLYLLPGHACDTAIVSVFYVSAAGLLAAVSGLVILSLRPGAT
jgi:hypothetical protein